MILKSKFIINFLFCTGCILLLSCEQAVDLELKDPYTISVTGSDYIWHVLYPGKDQILNTEDDIEGNLPIYLPSKTNVNILLNSTDYLYFFELEEFDQIGMAIPDQSYVVNFKTPKSGTFEIKGNQMCGYTHQSLFGDLKILSSSKFKNWQINNQL